MTHIMLKEYNLSIKNFNSNNDCTYGDEDNILTPANDWYTKECLDYIL